MGGAEYDSIGTRYDVIKTTPFNTIERTNFRRNVQPFLEKPNSTVIDFGCGTGFYSEYLLKWGAKSVLGVDISPVMVDGARARLSNGPQSSQARFITGDGTKPMPYHDPESDGFDIATGAWFIVYAQGTEELTGMFKCISMNLKQDGVFVGIVYQPTDDLEGRARVMNNMRDLLAKTGVVPVYQEKLSNGLGYALRIFALPPAGSPPSVKGVDFNAIHLKKSIIEEAARAGGMNGKIEWRPIDFLGEEWRKELALEGDEEWRKIQENPYMSGLVIWKT